VNSTRILTVKPVHLIPTSDFLPNYRLPDSIYQSPITDYQKKRGAQFERPRCSSWSYLSFVVHRNPIRLHNQDSDRHSFPQESFQEHRSDLEESDGGSDTAESDDSLLVPYGRP